ncbi:MAG: transcription antitermination factor NusB [Bacteroidales bacterium]|nr:transcription antitermination factor NusB [Bacteroidales bacterium]
MLNRRQLRIKALQSLYAHFQSGETDIVATEKLLIGNLNKLYDLYIYQLSLLTAIQRFAEESLETSKNKYIPTPEDLNPNTRFIDNKFLHQIAMNKDFLKKEKNLKISWSLASDTIRKIVHDFRSSKDYVKYMQRDTNTYEQDKDIILSLVRNHLIKNNILRSHFEEINSMWSEDYYMSFAMVNITIHSYTEKTDINTKLPTLFKGESKLTTAEDKEFVINLVRESIINEEAFNKIIESKSNNWEFDRIATMDLILLRMGMSEVFYFDSIPLKVTLNEMIELAKHFSSPRSSVFVNGLLDRTISDGLRSKTINKKGRGLVGQ